MAITVDTIDGFDIVHATVCGACAVILVNGDVSAEDEDSERPGKLDALGLATPIGPDDQGGVWDCFGCDETVMERGERFEFRMKA